MKEILIAVSRPVLLKEYAARFLEEGFDVRQAPGGIECLRELVAGPPDLLVIDAELLWGGCDGVLEWLSYQPMARMVPLILLGSASSRARVVDLWEHATENLGLRIERVLFQPVSSRELLTEAAKVGLSIEHFDVRMAGAGRRG